MQSSGLSLLKKCPNKIAGGHPILRGCPTIQFQGKNMYKIRYLKPLNQKRGIKLLPIVIVGQLLKDGVCFGRPALFFGT